MNIQEGRRIPRMLYHYTTTQGLLGILASCQLFASHPRSMNDLGEFNSGLFIARKMLEVAYDQDGHGFTSRFRQAMAKWNEWLTQDAYFICCLTESADSLDMWRGYAPSQGFNIGFSVEYIYPLAPTRLAMQLNPVIYDEEEFRMRVAAVLDKRSGLEGEGVDAELFHLATLYKDNAWENEREWRLTTTRRGWGDDQEFRAGQFGVAPYVRLPFACEGQRINLSLKSVTVGPGPFRDDSLEMVAYLLKCNRKYAMAQARVSKVPLR